MIINKPIVLVCADIYLRFPEIMEEEYKDLIEFLEDEHILFERSTTKVLNLEKENKNLQSQLEQKEDNWNKLKEWLEEEYERCDKIGNPAIGFAMGQIKRIKSKMQEIEKGDDNE